MRGIENGEVRCTDRGGAIQCVVAWFGVRWDQQSVASAVRFAQVLMDPCPETLLGAADIGGVAATTAVFVYYTRAQFPRHGILEPEQRTHSKGVRQ